MQELITTPYQIRRDRHYDRLNGLHAELLGYIGGTLRSVDDGRRTPEQALAAIREETDRTAAAIKASWDELKGGEQ